MSMIQTAVLALVALVLGLFVIRPVLTSASRAALPAPEAPLALPPAMGPGTWPSAGWSMTGSTTAPSPTCAARSSPEAPEEDPATRLRRLIEQRQTESIEILRGWMEEEEHA
jgi:flagellar M-ring protein FliF